LAAGFEEGIRGQQVRLDRAIGTTTPDVIYRAAHHDENEGVCIYLDGLSGHIHGNAATAEQDSRIRTWLRNNGYEVIEIAFTDLDDQAAMERHFRKLAGYLEAADLREALRADRTWFEKAAEAVDGAARAVLRIVRPRQEDRYVTCLPLLPLRAAAGSFGEPQTILEWDTEWVEVDSRHKLQPGMFVAQVVGKSMEPAIPDGSYCVFRAPVAGTRQGKTVLVQLRDAADPETGERYTVKKYQSEKAVSDEGTWRHIRVTLRPTNAAYQPIELMCDDEEAVRVIAEALEVLGCM
jgi:SOS-response transcriptional repressor LexA